MKEKTFSAFICKDYFNIPYYVCRITYVVRDDESYKYVFEPNYRVISLLNNDFMGIPGLDLSLKKREYIRENQIPVFISERVPQKNRENLFELLDKVGMDYMNPILYLLKTKEKYSGDEYYLKEDIKVGMNPRFPDFKSTGDNLITSMKAILSELAKGNNIIFDNFEINEDNACDIHHVISMLYYKGTNYKIYTPKNIHSGRPKKNTDILKQKEIVELYKNNKISVSDAISELNVSRRTFYRILQSDVCQK